MVVPGLEGDVESLFLSHEVPVEVVPGLEGNVESLLYCHEVPVQVDDLTAGVRGVRASSVLRWTSTFKQIELKLTEVTQQNNTNNVVKQVGQSVTNIFVRKHHNSTTSN